MVVHVRKQLILVDKLPVTSKALVHLGAQDARLRIDHVGLRMEKADSAAVQRSTETAGHEVLVQVGLKAAQQVLTRRRRKQSIKAKILRRLSDDLRCSSRLLKEHGAAASLALLRYF